MTANGSKVRVYIACSLDGFIAGPNDDLSWLSGATAQTEKSAEPPVQDEGCVTYDRFMEGVGALLMGRRTYDVVSGFNMPWPYGSRPVLVATNRSLMQAAPTVRPITAEITKLVEAADEVAGGKDIYIDGGNLIRQALDAGLIDDLIVTVVPVVLGAGHSLFAGSASRHNLQLTGHYSFGFGMVQLQYQVIPTVNP